MRNDNAEIDYHSANGLRDRGDQRGTPVRPACDIGVALTRLDARIAPRRRSLDREDAFRRRLRIAVDRWRTHTYPRPCPPRRHP